MKAGRLVTIITIVTVVIAVVAGLYLSGSPGEQRLLRLDERRVADLLRLSNLINSYREETGRLPLQLSVLVDGQRLTSVPIDPETKVMYTYEIANSDSYRLCAEFARGSEADIPEDFWTHASGLQCFTFRVGADR